MFEYYSNAQKCYVFISDVFISCRTFDAGLTNAKWWRRGWTLQGLLASTDLTFYDQRWRSLGTKWEIKGTILSRPRSLGTRKHGTADVLGGNKIGHQYRGHCHYLMGIFGEHMPILYGKGGQRAFLRLQEEITRSSDDQTLVVWLDLDPKDTQVDYHGLLPDSPKAFEKTGNMRPYTDYGERSPYPMTNRGPGIEFHLRGEE